MVAQGVSGLEQSLAPIMSSPKGETKRLVNARAAQFSPTVSRAAAPIINRHHVSRGARAAAGVRNLACVLILSLVKLCSWVEALLKSWQSNETCLARIPIRQDA